MSTTVLVAGGSTLVRSVLRETLRDASGGAAEVADARDAEEVLARCTGGVQVLVSGVDVGGTPLVALLPRVLAAPTRVLVVCSRASAGSVPELLLHGASGSLVLEECQADELWAAVGQAATGMATLHPGIATLILEQWREARAGRTPSLTPKETQVLTAMLTGEPVKSIARQLGLSARTVDSHRARIFVKLGVRTHAQAVQRALDLGLVGRAVG